MSLSFTIGENPRFRGIMEEYDNRCMSFMDLFYWKGDLPGVKWSSEVGSQFSAPSLRRTCHEGQLEVMKILRSHGHGWVPGLMDAARSHALVDWLRANGCHS